MHIWPAQKLMLHFWSQKGGDEDDFNWKCEVVLVR